MLFRSVVNGTLTAGTVAGVGSTNLYAAVGQFTAGIANISTSQLISSSFGYELNTPKTVATLPGISGGSRVCIFYVTDALAPTYGATVVGGGTVITLVMWDGTAWKVH